MSSQAEVSTCATVIPLPRRHNTNRGRKFPPEPIRPEELALMIQHCTPQRPGREAQLSAMRLRCMLVILSRAGSRISEALALYEFDLRRSERAMASVPSRPSGLMNFLDSALKYSHVGPI